MLDHIYVADIKSCLEILKKMLPGKMQTVTGQLYCDTAGCGVTIMLILLAC